MPIVREEKLPAEHVCSRCGHREPVREFKFPSASLVISGNERKYILDLGEGKPLEFKREPTRVEIKNLLDEIQAKKDQRRQPAKPVGAPKE